MAKVKPAGAPKTPKGTPKSPRGSSGSPRTPMASQQGAGSITSSGKPGLVSTERGRNGPNEDDVGQALKGVARAMGQGNGDSDEEDEENLEEQGQVPRSACRNPIDDIFGNRGKTTGLDDEELESGATSEPQGESDSNSDSDNDSDDSDEDDPDDN